MNHKYVNALILSITMASLSACVPYSSSEAVKPLSADIATGAFISDIEIKALPPDSPPEFKDALQKALQTDLKKCATGTHPLRLEARVARFKDQERGQDHLSGRRRGRPWFRTTV
ncbi:MAG: hypothetical protein PW843_17745 [Azospirillaceae bacterium]|nr:hypothetical protein [Azospirillaceae bacterium]